LDWSSNNSQAYPGILETWLLPRFTLVYQWLQSGIDCANAISRLSLWDVFNGKIPRIQCC
jgi:hypothetical protein